jgi:ubiquinone biosynthesis protein
VKTKWVPTPLVDGSKRGNLPVQPASPPSRGGVFGSLWQVLRFLALLLSLRFRRTAPRQKAILVRGFLERRGGLWIKISQTLASRHDALPDVYCDELGKLFDSATAFPWEQARRVMEESLGRPLGEVFAEFSEEPIAAASIAQTYRARLRWNDADVAVKVRRPYVETIFRRDLRLVRVLAGILERIPRFQHLHPLDMHGELELMLLEELDFRVEATLIRDMRGSLRKHRVHVPRVFSRYCNREILVMSFVDGVLMSDYLRALDEDRVRVADWLAENEIDPRKLARRIYFSCQRQVFEDNLFHGDLHPGNIMLLRRNRFALLDFGAVGTLDLNTRKQVMLYHRLVGEGDLSRAMLVLIHMSSPVPRIDVASFLRRLVRVSQKSLRFMTVKGLPYEERIYSDATSQQLRMLGKARIPVSWDFLRAQRTFTVLEMSLRQLDPKIEPMKLSNRYFRVRERRERKSAGGELRQLLSYIETIATDAGTLLRDMSDARVLAGKIWGLSLGAEGARFVHFVAGIVTKGLALVFAMLLLFWAIQHHAQLVPRWIQRLLSAAGQGVPPLTELSWLGLCLLVLLAYRIAAAVRRSFG